MGNQPGWYGHLGHKRAAHSVSLGQNGYVLTWISNADINRPVHFDNLQVVATDGRLVQEQNYYPFGLAINQGQSSTTLANKFLHQGKEMQDDLGLDWSDFHARQYDQQIGRFCSVDPLSQFPSSFTGMGNDPANGIDPSGMQSVNASNGSNVVIHNDPGGDAQSGTSGGGVPLISGIPGLTNGEYTRMRKAN